MPTICIVTFIPSPYQVEFFNEFNKLGAWRLRVVYLQESDIEHPWTTPTRTHEYCVAGAVNYDYCKAWEWCMEADLTVFNFYTNAFALAAIHARSATGRPWAFWGERPGFLKLVKTGQFLRRLIMRPLRSEMVPIWGVGKFAIEQYLEEWGPNKSYFNLPYFSNLTRFTELIHEKQDGFIILYSGMLNSRKDVLTLAKAFLKLALENPRVRLWVLGCGPLEEAMREALQSVADRVIWFGFRSWDELPSIYQKADVLCLPSLHDGWAMVVLEALASGLPVIATSRTGAAIEFVKTGANGWLIPPGDEKHLLGALREAAFLPSQKLADMRAAARQSIMHHTLANGAKRLLSAANQAVAASYCRIAPRSLPFQYLPNVHILLAGNYVPDGQPSMHRYARLVARALADHGVSHSLASPAVILGRISGLPKSVSKILGFMDKYLLFPMVLRWQASRQADGKEVLIHLLDQGNALYLHMVRDFNIVATCHDLIAIRAASGEISTVDPPSHGPFLQKAILRALGLAKTLICVSKKTRDDCRRLLFIPQPKLTLTLNPLDPTFESVSKMEYAQALPQRFLFHIGNSSWYKNRPGLLRIYSELRKIYADTPILLMMGASLTPEEKALIKLLDLGEYVIFSRNPLDEQVCAAYNRAQAFLFPSFEEGFGWPILEAMACGCPVFTSNRAPMTEVGGDAAIYIDPENPIAAAAVISENLSKGNEWRISRAAAGRLHVKFFTFAGFSSSLMKAYDLALGRV